MFGSVGHPHAVLYDLSPGLFWLSVLSDSLLALSFLLIPVLLLRIVRGGRDLSFNGVRLSLAALLLTLGVVRVLNVAGLWRPMPWETGVLKTVAGLIALLTCVLLLRLAPNAPAVSSRAEHNDMEKANRQMQSVLESTTICVLAMDSGWKVNYVNRNARVLLKVQGEMLGMTLWEAFPVDQPAIRDILLKVMETRQPASYEKYYEPLNLSVTVQAHPWDDGGVAIFFSDISAQKQMQRELDWERVMREQRLEVLARFSAGIAHEMKNPLAIIHARASDLAEVVEEGEASRDEVAKTCASIVKTSDRALRILRGLAALAREGANDPMQAAEVGEMVKQAIELVQARYQEQGILIEAHLPDDLPTVECREVQIGQILMNLLNNAFDAIDASPASERWVRVEAFTEGLRGDPLERLLIDVIDGGPELAAEVKEHLMETFYTTKPFGGGIGIGLSVSRAIADDHGGSLELRDCDGHTCFRLSLPVRVVKQAEVAA